MAEAARRMPAVPARPPADASPWALGGLTLRQLGQRVWTEMWDDEVLDRAAALSYYFLFALFPTLLFLTTFLGLMPVPDLMVRLMEYAARALPDDAFSLLQKTLNEVVRGANTGLLSLGIAVALWAAASGMLSTMTALNVAYDVVDPRPWWKQRLIAVALTIGFSLFTLTSLLLLIFGERIGGALATSMGLGSLFTAAWAVIRWPAVVLLLLFGVTLVYYVAPAVRQRLYWVMPGSAFAVVGWLVTSSAFRLYVKHMGNFNATYGSIGGVIVLLLWFYLTAIILLLGAEINAEIAQAAIRRARAARAPARAA